ncbi:hypothetical protein CLIB1423_33S00606 [[Candida] railenensis]|uniref:Uncharacterized protein n=1 Tax=[Candida] railenensis TaxID=45579 RepID=A0A9P0QUA4_9ASCO|nr:hypothetical protein CLIB1423_33S00606 [[Candida] railenensis]
MLKRTILSVALASGVMAADELSSILTTSVGDYSIDTSSYLSYYGSVFGVSFSDYSAFLTFGENLDVSSYVSHLSQLYSADPSAYSSAVAAFQSDATLTASDTAAASSGAGGTGSNSIAASTTSGSGSGSESGSGSTTETSGSSASSGSSSASGSASDSSTSSKAGVYSVGVPVAGLFAALALVL